jgi:putative PIG3 family NAD(P)H quinone oxidoreductase
MRAIVLDGYGGPEVLKWKEVPDPQPTADEVVVRVQATAVNRADLIQRAGGYPAPEDAPRDILGLEFSGEVAELGKRARGFSVGDRVFGLAGGGTYAEKVAVHAETLVKMPDGLSFEDAAALPEATITAYDAMVAQAGLAAGEWLLISAVGSGVGTAAVQIAKAIGARTIGTSRTEDKLERAKALGLDVGIHAKTVSFADAVMKATGRGADVVLELVGGAYMAENLVATSPRGRIVLVGLTGGANAELNLALVLRKRLHVMGTVLRARPLAEKIAAAKLFERHLVPLIAKGAVRAVVHEVLPLVDARAAHERVGANEGFGKFVLRVD